jgi:hypothetical protein
MLAERQALGPLVLHFYYLSAWIYCITIHHQFVHQSISTSVHLKLISPPRLCSKDHFETLGCVSYWCANVHIASLFSIKLQFFPILMITYFFPQSYFSMSDQSFRYYFHCLVLVSNIFESVLIQGDFIWFQSIQSIDLNIINFITKLVLFWCCRFWCIVFATDVDISVLCWQLFFGVWRFEIATITLRWNRALFQNKCLSVM